MRYGRQCLSWIGLLLGALVVLAGCTHDAEIQRLSLAEQSEFHIYRKVMTSAQEQAYLAQPNAAARTAYLSQIGLAQRFQALEPQDRDAVQRGLPQAGMSAEALRFVWGEPAYTAGDARNYAHWFYPGSSFGRSNSGARVSNTSNRVDVYIVAGKVVGWVDEVPATEGDSGGERRN